MRWFEVFETEMWTDFSELMIAWLMHTRARRQHGEEAR
jgi:hypothetical protein